MDEANPASFQAKLEQLEQDKMCLSAACDELARELAEARQELRRLQKERAVSESVTRELHCRRSRPMPDRVDTAVVPVARFTIPDGTPLCHLCYGCGHFAGGTCWECLGTGYDGKVVRALRDAAKRKAGLTDA